MDPSDPKPIRCRGSQRELLARREPQGRLELPEQREPEQREPEQQLLQELRLVQEGHRSC
jgi:hypothetical protein